MKLSIAKDQLNLSIQYVSKAISNRTTIPILSGIKIEASPAGVTFTASDTDISIQTFSPWDNGDAIIGECTEQGTVVLPARIFAEMVRKLPAEQVELEAKDNFQTIIRSGSLEVQLVGFDPEEYPLLPQIEERNKISFTSDLLKTMIKQTSFAVSTSETSPILTGVLWTATEDGIKLIGCDRHRLATRETPLELQPDHPFQNIVIAGRTLNELNKILPDQNILVDIVVSQNQVLFKLDNVLFYSRILDGTYPDVSKLIPQQFQAEMYVHTKQLIEAIDRAYLFSREDRTNIVKLVMKEDQTIEISSQSSELGKVTENLAMHNHTGERFTVSFNSKYMIDALKVIDSEKVKFGFTGPMNPIVIQPEDETKILQLILPYRTTS
ncbi:DNA polymerase III subunit beta [Paenibacillus senegalensis]|uniref:DNA polymerase III subunit beta n=1 Tax=Paenibacillus senegalensis TaxID=1465766 RepID=UPI000289EF97|nr:DNA polymerase III subunit beta [Paenibacillus senegalensis]